MPKSEYVPFFFNNCIIYKSKSIYTHVDVHNGRQKLKLSSISPIFDKNHKTSYNRKNNKHSNQNTQIKIEIIL